MDPEPSLRCLAGFSVVLVYAISLISDASLELHRTSGNRSLATPRRPPSVYRAQEEGICCNNRITLMPGTSNGPVRPFRPWLSTASLPQRLTAASAGGGSAPPTPKMRLGTSAPSSPATKVAKLRPRIRGRESCLRPGLNDRRSWRKKLCLDFCFSRVPFFRWTVLSQGRHPAATVRRAARASEVPVRDMSGYATNQELLL